MRKIFRSSLFIPIILLLIFSIPSFKDTLTVGYFSMHDDLQVIRQLVMDKCFQDGQVPCRWSEDMGYGYGYPLFNYYPPFPYYLGEVFRPFSLPYVDIVKVLVVLSFLASGLTMYLLAREFWGKWGGLLSAILYVYAPYHAVDIYVRGAMNEAWAMVWFPVIFWLLYKLIMTNKWIFVPWLAIFTAFLMLSHNPTLMIFAPGALLWSVFWIWQSRNLSVITKLMGSALWALGLAAFFTIPVILEQKDAHVETLVMGYFNYLAHFANINQLFISRFWGYGPSVLGPGDGMSFQIGQFHWILTLVSLIVALMVARKNQRIALLIILMFFMTGLYTFMTHEKSSFIWSRLPQLEFLQFPWRFLTLTVFGMSFLGGSLVWLASSFGFKRLQVIFAIVVAFGTIYFYMPFFHWDKHWPWVTDSVKLSGELWKQQITAGIFDYLPKSAPRPPGGPPNGYIELLTGKAEMQEIIKNSIDQEYKVSVSKDAVFQINTYYFPGWKYFVNGKETVLSLDEELGRPVFKLPVGEYSIIARFTNTPVRLLGNTLSVLSWLGLVSLGAFLLYRNFYKKKLIHG